MFPFVANRKLEIKEYKHWLFTDLDGTLIPLEGDQQNVEDLASLTRLLIEKHIGLAFVTGRHRSSAVSAIAEFDLPTPQWVVSDVGTRVSEYRDGDCVSRDDYRSQLLSICNQWTAESLIEALSKTDEFTSIRLQEAEKQGEFKVSFYAEAGQLEPLCSQYRDVLQRLDAPFIIVSSVDPFTGDGLIDFLPTGVDKAFACKWLAEKLDLQFDRDITYAGDSGNDLAALTSGCRAVLVGNASDALKEDLREFPQVSISKKNATSALLEQLNLMDVDPKSSS